MKEVPRVRVELGKRSYDIIFSAVDSPAVLEAFSALPQKNVLITADSNTAQYLPRVAAAMEKSGKTVYSWVLPAGEASKNMDNAMKLCGYASSLKLGRNALFAALGGGVTGDLTGFAAAMFMRGVDFIQIPTSLLAMVDSSVGGKTAVDTVHGKNLVGAFHQPSLVVIDCGLLDTLPARELGSGMAEIIKTAMIRDAGFVRTLINEMPSDILSDKAFLLRAVKRSCEIKAMVVSADEKESGDSGRVFLNYGHTFGHAIEHLSRFRLTHGEAVAVGMDMAAFAAVKLGLCDEKLQSRQYDLLTCAGIAPGKFPLSAVKHDVARIVELMKGDKKNGDGRFRAVLPLADGEVKTVDLDPGKTAELLTDYYAWRFPENPGVPADERPEAAVVGLGLLGSSLAMSLDHRHYRVGVWNRDPEGSRIMMESGAAERIYRDVSEAFRSADIVVLCLPIPVTVKFIRQYHDQLKPGAVLTDVSSVKTAVMDAAEEFPDLNFVGGHPMAGTEKSGYRSGFRGLYENADVFVVPGKYSTGSGIEAVTGLWEKLNTHVRMIDPAAHDALVAHTSHMLHIIASALTRSILDRDDPSEQRRHYSGCATGFRDTSRIASSSPEMWKDICLANTPAILPALDEFQNSLDEMRSALVAGDGERFAGLFRQGRDLRDSWLCYKNVHNLPENIVLCGIKHSGKSSVGRAIAEILDIPFADSDDMIVQREGSGRSVREIFREEGEEFFRKLEADVLTALADSPARQVIALGGGALSNPFVTADVKHRLGFKVWLNTDDNVAFERILKNGLPPFLAGESDPSAAFIRMNEARKKVFAAEADAAVIPENSCYRTALHILSLYKDRAGL